MFSLSSLLVSTTFSKLQNSSRNYRIITNRFYEHVENLFFIKGKDKGISISLYASTFISSSCWQLPLLCFILINGHWMIPSLSITNTTITSLSLSFPIIHFTFNSLHRRCSYPMSSSTTIRPPLPHCKMVAPRSRTWPRNLAIMLVSAIVVRRSTLSTRLSAPFFPPPIIWYGFS